MRQELCKIIWVTNLFAEHRCLCGIRGSRRVEHQLRTMMVQRGFRLVRSLKFDLGQTIQAIYVKVGISYWIGQRIFNRVELYICRFVTTFFFRGHTLMYAESFVKWLKKNINFFQGFNRWWVFGLIIILKICRICHMGSISPRFKKVR